MNSRTSQFSAFRLFAVAAIVSLGVVTIVGSGGGGGGGGGSPPAPTLTSLAVTPGTPSIVIGATQQFTATGRYSDGSSQNLTATANWSSSDVAVATIDANGLATSVDQGATTITATVSGISATATLTVDPANIVSISVTPADPILGYRGATQQFVATGTYSNQATADLTDSVTWGSSDTSVAEIGSDGMASVVAISGSTTISAEFSGITGTTTLSVRTATVSGEVTFPASDMGWQPSLFTYLAEGGGTVRVQGSNVAADVTPVNATTGSFDLAGVPWGDVTLVFEEGENYDVFTQSSKRLSVNVNSNAISGADFNFVYHWEELAGYPAPWGTVPEWQAHFVSPDIAFIQFRIRGVPEQIELYRTTDGGQSWTRIGQWIFDQAAWETATWPYPLWDLDFYFLDANRGFVHATTLGIPCDVGAHYFYTNDGGQTWNTTTLPLTPTGYHARTRAYARIGDDHVIMVGSVGCGVQGYNSGFYDAVWESPNAGADWSLVWHSARDEVGGFIGVDANADGRAVAYRDNQIQQFLLRDTQGVWASQGAGIVNNSLRDIAMVNDTAWIASYLGAVPSGTYRSEDAGVSWERVSDAVPQDFDFATRLKGFMQAGGPAYVTYDSGASWRYQSAGGAVWPGNMDIWAFSRVDAAWAETGFGDPNQTSQLFTYVEPREANIEIRENVELDDANVARGAAHVPMASLLVMSHGPDTINMPSLTLDASGSGDDAADVATVELWWDRNGDGIADGGDEVLSAGTFNDDNGSVSLPMVAAGQLEQLNPVYLLVTFDLSMAGNYSGNYRVSLDTANITAEDATTGAPVAASAPDDFVITPRSITVLP
jgi:hypothetical protein